jgi:hypothetical protein
VGNVERLAQQLAGFGTTVSTPQHRAEVGECGSIQPDATPLERVDRLT